MDAQLERPGGGRLHGGPVDRLGALQQCPGVAQEVPFLGQDNELGAIGGGLADQPLGGREVAGLVGRGVQLDGGGADLVLLDGQLTDQSIGQCEV
jgi:hypothetical protein